ncbi:MAG: hypothetical protein PUA84_05605 [Oscillospiraceae bacterium]|nr:hypothetical protein [Oscillospiraceae bacterium]
MNKSTVKSMLHSIKLMGLGSMFPCMILFCTAINAVNAFTGYDMHIFGGNENTLWNVSCVAFVVVLLVSAVSVATSFGNYYKLLVAMPVKLDKMPSAMMLLCDFLIASVAVIDAVMMLAAGYGSGILLKMSAMFIIYAFLSILFYVATRTGFKSYGITGKVVSVILYIAAYGVCTGAYMMATILIYEDVPEIFGNTALISGIFIASAAIGLLARVLSYVGVRNCVRQRKIYKTKNETPREESYV